MGAIAGCVQFQGHGNENIPYFENMLASMAYRGSAGKAVHVEPGCMLARLQSAKPCITEDLAQAEQGPTRFVCAFTGRLYNVRELKRELGLRGRDFPGVDDEQLVLNAYMEWGAGCVDRLLGAFAFAVWDQAARLLFLARDRLGKCPMFYHMGADRLVFSSEIKSILAFGVPAVLGEEGIMELIALAPARRPGSGVYKGISELRGGFSLMFHAKGHRLHRYWQVKSHDHGEDADDTAERIRAVFDRNVRREMDFGGEITSLLSGGLDSSGVGCVASKYCAEAGKQLRTASLEYFENEKYFEADAFQPNSDPEYAEYMRQYLGSEHRRIVLDTPELVAFLEEAMLARSLPGMADVDSSLLLVFRQVSGDAILSGECADELFGGYPWFLEENAFAGGTFPWSKAMELRRSLAAPGISFLLFEDYTARCLDDTLLETPLPAGCGKEEAYYRRLFYTCLHWFGASLLERKERISALAGVEARLPYYEEELVQYAWNIPYGMKRLGGMEKGILRKAFLGIVPEKVLQRKKSPFPKTWHASFSHAVANRIRLLLEDASAPVFDLYNRETVAGLLEGQMPGRWYGQLMGTPQLLGHILQVDAWMRDFHVSLDL